MSDSQRRRQNAHHRRPEGQRARRPDHPGSGPRERHRHTHALPSRWAQRCGRMPPVPGRNQRQQQAAACLRDYGARRHGSVHQHRAPEEAPPTILELLFAERNHICSVCVANGHCELQTLGQQQGMTHVRLPYRNPELTVDASHERFTADHNRCILCTRCVRVCAEIEGAHIWDVMGRGINSR